MDADTGDSGEHEVVATMAAVREPARVAFSAGRTDLTGSMGAWWPQSRSLADELGDFFASWPAGRGHISRVLFSPPDWDDHPRSVPVPGRRVKVGSFPHDDTHQLILTLSDGERRRVTVIPPAETDETARAVLASFSAESE